MTTTAFDDQFTDAPEPVRQPYDTGSILRRNVADLEIALKQQTERAEAADEKLTTAREDMQSWIDSRNGWMERAGAAEAELERLREQEPIKYLYRVTDCFGHDVLRDDPKGATILETIPLYAAPVAAPAVPDWWNGWRDVAVHGYPEKPMECMFVLDGRTVHGAYLGGAFWFSNERVAIALWMPMPKPLSPDSHRALLQSAPTGEPK